jgi:hypothetical protein
MDEKRKEAIRQAISQHYPLNDGDVVAFEQALRDAGYVICPVEPTDAMIERGNTAIFKMITSPRVAEECYRVMIEIGGL